MFIKKSTAEESNVIQAGNNRITLVLLGDASTVTATLYQSDGEVPPAFTTPVVIDGTPQVLSATNTMLSIYAPCEIKVIKSAGSDCGVGING